MSDKLKALVKAARKVADDAPYHDLGCSTPNGEDGPCECPAGDYTALRTALKAFDAEPAWTEAQHDREAPGQTGSPAFHATTRGLELLVQFDADPDEDPLPWVALIYDPARRDGKTLVRGGCYASLDDAKTAAARAARGES